MRVFHAIVVPYHVCRPCACAWRLRGAASAWSLRARATSLVHLFFIVVIILALLLGMRRSGSRAAAHAPQVVPFLEHLRVVAPRLGHNPVRQIIAVVANIS